MARLAREGVEHKAARIAVKTAEQPRSRRQPVDDSVGRNSEPPGERIPLAEHLCPGNQQRAPAVLAMRSGGGDIAQPVEAMDAVGEMKRRKRRPPGRVAW